jgi:predicted RNase H-like nuclease (RuvC/YqgF family)
MTLETVLGLIGIIGAALTAGRVVFSTERNVAHLEKQLESLSGKSQALDALVNESRNVNVGLAARQESLAEVVAQKASAESVVSLRELIEVKHRDTHEQLGRIERLVADLARVDREHSTPRRRTT